MDDPIEDLDLAGELAPTEIVDHYRIEVDRILDIIGHPEAFVSDASEVGDFDELEEDGAWLLTQRLGFRVDYTDRIALLAVRLQLDGGT